ncbi:hypothetical protein ACQEV4_24340 [Streptomyces shenzhenensis]|uniref:hypothetical protein n=1 Tax=Streptomyces shenzhenensis TaxID=943815 RepID=UPI003D8E5CBC
MDLIYGTYEGPVPQEQDPSVQALYRASYEIDVFSAARYRLEQVRRLMQEVSEDFDGAIGAAVGAGHTRETVGHPALASGRMRRYYAIDQDTESLAVAGAQPGVVAVQASVRDLLTAGCLPHRVHFVSGAGLFDYLAERTAKGLIRAIKASLEPGGRILIPNVTRTFPDTAYLEAVMEWPLVKRDENDMERLFEGIEGIQRLVQHRDPTGSIVFAEAVF